MFKINFDKRTLFLLLSLIIMMTTGVVACKPKPIKRMDNIYKSESLEIADNTYKSDNIVTCKIGQTIETINENQNFKAIFTCLDDLGAYNYKHYKLNNGKILLFTNFPNRLKLSGNNYVFDPKIKQFSKINNKFLIEKDFQYGTAIKLPKNKQIITDKILFNSENNRLYEVPEDEYQKLKQFKKDSFAKFYSIKEVRLFAKNNTLTLYTSNINKNSKDYIYIWLQDSVYLKNYKIGKLNHTRLYECSSIALGDNKFVIVGGGNKKIELYNANTGIVSYIGETKQSYFIPSLMLLKNNNLAICTDSTIELFNLKTAISNIYSYDNKEVSMGYESFYSFALLNEDYILMYCYAYNHSVLFNIKKKIFYDLKNFNKKSISKIMVKSGLHIEPGLFGLKDEIVEKTSKISTLGDSSVLVTGGALTTDDPPVFDNRTFYYNSAELFSLKPLNKNINKEL